MDIMSNDNCFDDAGCRSESDKVYIVSGHCKALCRTIVLRLQPGVEDIDRGYVS